MSSVTFSDGTIRRTITSGYWPGENHQMEPAVYIDFEPQERRDDFTVPPENHRVSAGVCVDCGATPGNGVYEPCPVRIGSAK